MALRFPSDLTFVAFMDMMFQFFIAQKDQLVQFFQNFNFKRICDQRKTFL